MRRNVFLHPYYILCFIEPQGADMASVGVTPMPSIRSGMVSRVRPNMLFFLPKFPVLNSPNSAYYARIMPNYAQNMPKNQPTSGQIFPASAQICPHLPQNPLHCTRMLPNRPIMPKIPSKMPKIPGREYFLAYHAETNAATWTTWRGT